MIKFFTKRMNNEKGFTLIELVVVIAILGILVAIAIPRLSGFTANAASRTILADIKTLETAAVAYVAETPTAFTDVTLTNLSSFLDDEIVTRYGGGAAKIFDVDGKVVDLASVTVGGKNFKYTASTKVVAPVAP